MSATPRTFSTFAPLPDSPAATVAPLVVVPWSKFGARRLRVDTTDGRHVGWVNLDTGHRSLAIPELEPAFEIAVSESEDAGTPRSALAHAIECALIEGLASQDRTGTPPEATVPAGNADDDPATTLRHAYRGKQAYSTWDLGARGKRLMTEEADAPAAMDLRWAYQNAAPARRAAGGARFIG